MNISIHSKIIKIGNSHGIRIPRVILEQAGLVDEVEMRIDGGNLIISAPKHLRQDWSVKFKSMAEHGDDYLLDDNTNTDWDEEEWIW